MQTSWRPPAIARASSRSGTSKLLTPHERILPSATQLLEGRDGVLRAGDGRASAAGSSRASRCRAGPAMRSQARDRAAPRRVRGQHLRDEEHVVRGGRRCASATISSTPPSPYISAVSMCVMPRSRPRRSAAIADARSSASMPPGALSDRRHVVRRTAEASALHLTCGAHASPCQVFDPTTIPDLRVLVRRNGRCVPAAGHLACVHAVTSRRRRHRRQPAQGILHPQGRPGARRAGSGYARARDRRGPGSSRSTTRY